MPDPIPKTELPVSPQIVVGETPIYLKSPIRIGTQEVSSLVIQSSDKRGITGIESSTLMVREPSRKKGDEGKVIDKPVIHVGPRDEMAWDKISGIQWTDDAGVSHTIPKEKLTLEQPTGNEQKIEAPLGETPVTDVQPEVSPETAASAKLPAEAPAEVKATAGKEARRVLETLTEDPNTITIVGLRGYETRALDLADRAMQKLGGPRLLERAQATKNLWDKTKDSVNAIEHFVVDTIWKQSIGGIYFHERARQYYLDMLTAAETPFAEASIRLAEAQATEQYNKKLADSNFLVRAGTQVVESLRGTLGMRTTIQNMAFEEIGVMKANGELKGAEIFERESKAVRARFSQDMDKADQFVRSQLGEKLEILDITKEEHQPLVEGIQGLLKQYATGEIPDRAEFDKRTKEFFNSTLKNARPDIFAEAELYSSSLFDAAEVLRNKMSHEAGLANIDEAMAGIQIRLGLGQMGEVTSLEPTAVERGIGKVREIFEWLNKKNVIVPMVFNEVAIGSGVAIALSAFNLAKTMPFKLIGGPIGSITGGALAGGAFAGWKEYGQLQKDYLTHLRERESGTQFTDTMKRRAWFEHFSVKQRSANEMTGTIQTAMDSGDYRTAMATIADLQARKAVSETGPKRIGLVQYSSREAIESERATLDVVASKALSDLSNLDDLGSLLGGNTFPDFMVKLTTSQTQVLKQGIGVMESFDDPVKSTLGLVSQYAPEADMIKRRWPFAGRATTPEEKAMGMDAILSEFNKEARMEAIKYGAKAGVIGAAVGVVLHIGDLQAAATHTSPMGHVTGSASIGHTASTASPLPHETIPPPEVGAPQPVTVDGVHAMLPPGLTLQHTPGQPDSWELLGPDNHILATNLHFNPDGTLTDSTAVQQQLTDHGFALSTQTIPGEQVVGAAVPPPTEVGTIVGDNLTITGSELGKGGIWDYFLAKSHDVTTANGMKNLFRLYTHDHMDPNTIHFPDGSPHTNYIQEHLRDATYGSTPVKEIDLTRIPNDAQFKLPDSVFGQHGIDQFRALNASALTDYQHLLANDAAIRGPGDAINALYNSSDPTKHLDGIVLKMGYLGHDSGLPTDPKDVNLLMEKLGATIQSAPTNIGTPAPPTIHQIVISGPHPSADYPDFATRHISDAAGPYVAPAVTPDYPDFASRHLAESVARASSAKATELPWFPVFIPYHAALEMAPVTMETVANIQPGDMLLSPFGMENGILTKDAISARRSPRLTENPAAQLKQSDEIAWYLSNIPEQDAKTLTELTGQINQPISPDVRAIVTIPTSGATQVIYDRLSHYVGQTNSDGTPFDPKRVEFIVYDARLADQPEGPVNADIERFVKDHPEMNVMYLTHAYTDPQNPGQIKRDLTNVALSRISTLPVDNPDVAIISDNGGNTIGATYLASTIDAFDSQPTVDMLTGENRLDPQAYEQFPMLFAQHRAFELFDALVRHGESGRIPGLISGNNAVRAATLAGVGGYNSQSPIAEDRELAWVIRACRGTTSDTIRTVPELTATIDPTEIAYRMLQHVGVADASVARENNDTYKTLKWTDIAQKAADVYTKEKFETDLDILYKNIYPSLKASNPERFDQYFKRTMDALGVQYEITDGRIHVLDTANLPANMAAGIDLETFAKQTATEVVAATPPEPATPRESLEQMAGPAGTEPMADKPIETTVAASISSPDVGATVSQPEPTEAQKPAEVLPEGIEDRVNYILNTTRESTAAVNITTGELMDYLKTRLEMAAGTRITDGKIQIDGNTANLIDMKAKSLFGPIQFNGKMITDPQKGLIVDMNTVRYDLPLLMRLFEGRIKAQLGHFDQTLLLHMSQRIPKSWKADRINIVGEKVEVRFVKKAA